MRKVIILLGIIVGIVGVSMFGFSFMLKDGETLAPGRLFVHTYVVAFLDYNLLLSPTLREFTRSFDQLGEREHFGIRYQTVNTIFQPESLRRAAEILGSEKIDLIVTGQAAVPYIREKMPQVPVISILTANTEAARLTTEQPGNRTAFIDSSASLITGDRLLYALKLLPGLKTLLVLKAAKEGPLANPEAMKALRKVAAENGVTLVEKQFSTREELNKFFLNYDFNSVDAIFRYPDSFITANMDILLAMSRQPQVRKPLIVRNRTELELGGILSYGRDVEDYGAVAATMAYDILVKKISPSNAEAILAHDFKFGVNRSVATSLGIEIPQTLLEQADHIIE